MIPLRLCYYFLKIILDEFYADKNVVAFLTVQIATKKKIISVKGNLKKNACQLLVK